MATMTREVTAGDAFMFDRDRPDCIFRNHYYIKVGVMKNPEEIVESANKLSEYLMSRAIAFYRNYKMPESYIAFMKQERLQERIARTVWDYHTDNDSSPKIVQIVVERANS